MKFSYEVEAIFPTFIWTVSVDGIDNTEIKEYCHKVRKEKPGVLISNKGGWHSNEVVYPITPSLIELMNQLEIGANKEFSKYTGINDLMMGNFWININGSGDYNLAHDHQKSVLSGVYYVDVPEENMGNIVLERNDHSEYFLDRYKNTNYFSQLNLSLTPKTGRAYIFPSWIKHRVDKNETQSERISIAFNLVPNELPRN